MKDEDREQNETQLCNASLTHLADASVMPSLEVVPGPIIDGRQSFGLKLSDESRQ